MSDTRPFNNNLSIKCAIHTGLQCVDGNRNQCGSNGSRSEVVVWLEKCYGAELQSAAYLLFAVTVRAGLKWRAKTAARPSLIH